LKVIVFLLCLTAVSVALYAMDLPSLARRERARRSALAAAPSGLKMPARAFTDADLERYRRRGDPETQPASAPPSPPVTKPPRDLTREKAYWRRETMRHEREVARVEASLRRLEWRLNEKRAKRRSREWLTEDPTIAVLEDSIRSLTEERNRLQEQFRERARVEGALPGWIR
jgi:hypothetical protein